jgi:hypothetical protein
MNYYKSLHSKNLWALQTGYENWIHFSTFPQKMELQKKMEWNSWQHCFFYVTMLSKNVAKCWFVLYLGVGSSRLGYVARCTLMILHSYSCCSTRATFSSRIIPFYATHSLLNIEIHNFKLTLALTIVKNSDNYKKY